MKIKLKKSIGTMLVVGILTLGGVNTAYAASFGNSLNGASSEEVLQIRYNGAAWNYSKSGYKNASFKYTRDGRTLLSRTATNGKVTGSVWDDLRWGNKYVTHFSWNHQK